MESLTGIVFRRRHHEFFGGGDRYYTPFFTPTVEPEFTERQMRELSPEANRGMNVVPQLMAKDADRFLWAAKRLAELGYSEVNLNLGCPMGRERDAAFSGIRTSSGNFSNRCSRNLFQSRCP